MGSDIFPAGHPAKRLSLIFSMKYLHRKEKDSGLYLYVQKKQRLKQAGAAFYFKQIC